jgi:hypothetical protein
MMPRLFYGRIEAICWLPILCLGSATAAVNCFFDAAAQFSTSNGNPNGGWDYRLGSMAPPLVPAWNGNGTFAPGDGIGAMTMPPRATRPEESQMKLPIENRMP